MPERDDETRRSRRARRRESIHGNASHRGAGSTPRWLGGLVLFGGAFVLLALLYLGPIRGYSPTGSDAAGSSAKADDPRIKIVAGQVAPDFSLPDVNGTTFRLNEARANGNTLLFFQEGVACPACFQQMRDLRREDAKLRAFETSLITITNDPLSELKAASVREGVVGMPLLSDSTLGTSRAYDALYVSMHPGQVLGHTFVLLDRGGKVLWRRDYREMYVPVDQVLSAVAKGLGR